MITGDSFSHQPPLLQSPQLLAAALPDQGKFTPHPEVKPLGTESPAVPTFPAPRNPAPPTHSPHKALWKRVSVPCTP